MGGVRGRSWGPVAAIVAVGVLVVALGSSSAHTGWGVGGGAGSTKPGAIPAGTVSAEVARVVDGDTIEMAGGPVVRLIGVDAPAAGAPAECYGPQATARLNELLPPGTPVKLEYDEQRVDASGRTLAYVYRAGDGLLVNLSLVRDGFARDAIDPPNLAHVIELLPAVAEAEASRRGLWAACPSTRP